MIDSKSLCLMWQLIVAEDPSVQLYDYQVNAACEHSIDIIESANKYAIDPFILSAIVYNESRWTKDIKNKEGACGLAQVVYKYNPENESRKKCNKLLEPKINLNTSAKIIASYYSKSKDYYKALACYASGPKCTYKKYGNIIVGFANKLKRYYSKVKPNVQSSN